MIRNPGSHLLGMSGIVVGTLALITLTWIGTLTATRTERAAAEARVSTNTANQAQVIEEQLQRRLLEVDQALRILARAWQADPAGFNLPAWRDQLVLLDDLSPDVLIADEKGIVRHGTIPGAAGVSVSDRDYFRREAERASAKTGCPSAPPRLGQSVANGT